MWEGKNHYAEDARWRAKKGVLERRGGKIITKEESKKGRGGFPERTGLLFTGRRKEEILCGYRGKSEGGDSLRKGHGFPPKKAVSADKK